MSRLMSPSGSLFAQAYCQELYDCRVGLEIDTSEVYQVECLTITILFRTCTTCIMLTHVLDYVKKRDDRSH